MPRRRPAQGHGTHDVMPRLAERMGIDGLAPMPTRTRHAKHDELDTLPATRIQGPLRPFIETVESDDDIPIADLFDAHGDQLSEVVFRRCRHVITENARVLDASSALAADEQTQEDAAVAEPCEWVSSR